MSSVAALLGFHFAPSGPVLVSKRCFVRSTMSSPMPWSTGRMFCTRLASALRAARTCSSWTVMVKVVMLLLIA